MILDDFLFLDTNGLFCKYGNFYIDPQQSVNLAVISHAHADHAVAGNSDVYCTEATAAFMQLRYGKNAAKAFNISNYHHPFYWRGADNIYPRRAYVRFGADNDGIPGCKIFIHRRL